MHYTNQNGLNVRYCENMTGDKAKMRVTLYRGETPSKDDFIEFDIDDLLFLHDVAQNMRVMLINDQDRINRRIASEQAYLDGTEDVSE